MDPASTAAGAPVAPPAPDPGTPDPTATAPPAPDDGNGNGGTPPDPETFPREYVEKLRKESAGHRSRAKEAEDKVATFTAAQQAAADAEKTEAERLASKVEEERQARATAETELNRLRAANKFGVAPELVSLINGATPEEAEAQAELLSKHTGGSAGGTFPPMPHGTQPPPPAKGLAEQIVEAQREAQKSGDWSVVGRLKSQQLADAQKRK